jgi:hypothetical protein
MNMQDLTPSQIAIIVAVIVGIVDGNLWLSHGRL